MKVARALQSLALAAVIAPTVWLLVEDYKESAPVGPIAAAKALPSARALTDESLSQRAQPVLLGELVRQDVRQDEWAYYWVRAPAHAKGLKVRLQSLHGDADLYLRADGAPQGDAAHGGLFDASSATSGAQVEEISLSGAGDRHWYIGVHGYRDSSFKLEAEIE